MVATLLRLKFSLTKNSLKRETWTMVFLILGGISALGLIPIVAAGAFALSRVPTDVAALVLILAGSVLILGWCLLSVLVFGSDETLDPARFATLNIPARALTIGLLLSGFIGVPGIVTAIVVLTPALTWVQHPGAVAAAIVMAPIAVLSCFAFSRLLTTVAANSLRSRRGRDAIAITAFVALIAISQVVPFLSGSAQSDDLVAKLHTVADGLAWTPFGAPWAVPADVLAGNYVVAVVRVAISVGALALAVWLWSRALNRAMVSSIDAHAAASRDGNSIAKIVGGPWARWGTPAAWAIAGRCLRYWRSDPRYIMSVASVVLLPIVFVVIRATSSGVSDPASADAVMAMSVTTDALLAGVGPFLAMIMGWGLHNDIGSDSTAFWTHVSTGVSGKADRVGRTIALSIWFVPALIVVTVATSMVAGQTEHMPAILGAAAGLYFAGCAVSAVASAMLTYPVARPGDSPFKSQSGAAGITMAAQMLSTLVVLVVALPVLILVACDLMIGPIYGWAALAVGIVGGIIAAAIGVRRGAAIYDARSVKLLAQVVKADA